MPSPATRLAHPTKQASWGPRAAHPTKAASWGPRLNATPDDVIASRLQRGPCRRGREDRQLTARITGKLLGRPLGGGHSAAPPDQAHELLVIRVPPGPARED